MKWRTMRPVGEPLAPIRRGVDPASLLPKGYDPYFVQSGTAALALALLIAKESSTQRHRVLLPAYGCPDLVAAVVYAGLQPELVDTAPGLPFMDLGRLESQLDEGVVAVIGAHFLGLAENIAGIRTLAQRVGAVVVEDSAQRLPSLPDTGPVADLVVLSFGRGKPAGALGGGALLVKSGAFSGSDPDRHISPVRRNPLPVGVERAIYNAAIDPLSYSLLSRVPALHLGETRYHALSRIMTLSAGRRAAAISQLSSVSGDLQESYRSRAKWLVQRFESVPGLADTTVLARCAGREPLVRFPVLLRSNGLRERAYQALVMVGAGVSRMYGASLPEIPEVPGLRRESHANASGFAKQLLTLPLHSEVSLADLERASVCLASVCQSYEQ